MKLASSVLLFLSVVIFGFKSPTKMDKFEIQKGSWEYLFNGKDLTKWRQAAQEAPPSAGWIIKDGTLSVLQGRKGGDIITKETYSSFDLEWEFNLTENANSGIKYFVNQVKSNKTNTFSAKGIEYQIIDDLHYPEVKDDPNGLSSSGSVYLIYPPKNKKLNPAGNWNKARILVKGAHTEHWLNGIKVAEYERNSADFNARVSNTKFNEFPEFAKADSGHIMLTDHGDTVYFKNIRIKRL